MHHTIHLIQNIMGLAVALALLGWCGYRLAILFGLIVPKKRPKRPARQSVVNQDSKQTNGKRKRHNGNSIPRHTFYTAQRKQD